MKDVMWGASSSLDIDLLQTGDHYISCRAPECKLQSGNITIMGEKMPAGYCTCKTGKCYMAENNYKFRGMDTRVIVRRDEKW